MDIITIAEAHIQHKGYCFAMELLDNPDTKFSPQQGKLVVSASDKATLMREVLFICRIANVDSLLVGIWKNDEHIFSRMLSRHILNTSSLASLYSHV